MGNDPLILGGHSFDSRFILGSGKYSMELIRAAVEQAGAQIITLALRRANSDTDSILDHIPQGVTLLPNTSGARNADEAVRIARLARACGCGDFVKIEIMRDSKYLLPDNYETVKATEILAKEGFRGHALHVPRAERGPGPGGRRVRPASCPWALPSAPTRGWPPGTSSSILIDEIALPVIVDAGIGRPSQACEAMEMGAAAVMANTAIATAGDVPAMALAFKKAIEAGRTAYLAGLGRVMERGAAASSPLTGFLAD